MSTKTLLLVLAIAAAIAAAAILHGGALVRLVPAHVAASGR